MVVLLIIFLVLQIWALNSNSCWVSAIRTSPPPPPPPSAAKDSDEIKRSELYKRFFNGRFSRLNSTVPKDKNFEDNKRRVPSCPDPLHN
ncbi:hypothetical protein L1987_10981 [Smallanthus sonchifolius]|uniref:Uncharacterized protein n=1 Tax=Smallanthus sonchifolius TaxID=185202 RepID=A0ACB9JA13_9ASTR|nr:hypothetical protein L1987_10981 [Smallanthus sonchifolius]